MLSKINSINLIRIIHTLIIIYVIFAPLIYPEQIKNVIPLLIFILYRWITGDDRCTLTTIENQITGDNRGFIYRIINPIYKIRESKFNKILYMITILWLIILIFYYKNILFNKKDLEVKNLL